MLYQGLNNNYQLTTINKSNNKLIVTNDSNKKVKNLLLQGWRQRWTPPEFATYLKQQLSIISKSGDNYELSKLILQQAGVGRQPVILFIDYLDHLLSCGVISFGAVINSIIETCKKENTQVVICLIDFLLNQENNINCFSSEQDCLNLSTSLARLIKFIFNCLEFSLQRLNELNSRQFNNQLNQHEQAIDKCTKLLSQFKNSKFMISLIFIGLIEENQNRNLKSINFSDVYDHLEKLNNKFQDNKLLQTSQQNLIDFLHTIHKFNPNLQSKKYLQFENDTFNYRKSSNLSMRNPKRDDELITNYFNEQSDYLNKSLISLNCVVTFDAILNPKTPSTKLAYQLYRIAISNHLKFSIICCEFVKCSFVNFADALSLDQNSRDVDNLEIKFLNQFQRKISNQLTNKENSRWASFIFLKLPLVLKSLKQILKERNQTLDLEKGLEKLINYTPLLELVDYITNCDNLKYLLSKFVTLQLIDEQFQHNLLKKRDDKIEYFNNLNCKIDKTVLKNQSIDSLISIQGEILLGKIEFTANSVFNSFSPEVASKSDHLISMFINLHKSSFEILLNSLLYTGKLCRFIKRLIYFNEINNAPSSSEETSKQAILRNILFDHTFLILNLIVQEHGQEVILNCLEEEGVDLNRDLNKSTQQQTNGDEMDVDDQNSLVNSFFVKFCLDYLSENSLKVNYDDKFVKDLSKVDCLLGQFQNDTFDYQMIKWNEVLLNSISAFKELLKSYLHDYLKFEDLTIYLVNMMKRNCSIGLVISFYAINQITKVPLEQKRKIILILNFITNSNNFSFCFQDQLPNRNDQQDKNYNVYTNYKERYLLTSNIIKNLIKESIPKTIFDQQQLQSHQFDQEEQNNYKIELYKILKSIFLNAIKKGSLNTNSIYCFDKILCISGSNWFMDKLIKLLLYECDLENLDEGVELIYGLCTLDIEQCCLSLLNIIIPQYLVNLNDQNVLIEPKLIALSKLISLLLYSVLESDLDELKLNYSTVKRNSSHYIEDNFINYEDKLNEQLLNGNLNNGNIYKNDTPIYYIKSNDNNDKRKQLLLNSISRLLRLVSSLLNREKISQRTNFSLILLEQLIFKCTLSNNNLIDHKFNPNLITNSIDKLISNNLNNNSQIILKYLPFDTILNLVRIFPQKLNFDLLISICNLQSTNSRKILAKSICQLYRSKNHQ